MILSLTFFDADLTTREDEAKIDVLPLKGDAAACGQPMRVRGKRMAATGSRWR